VFDILETYMEPNTPEKIVKKETRLESFIELVKFAIIAVVIVFPIRMFIAQPFIVSGSSMVDTFHDKDYLIIDELSYRFEVPKRGDVVVFRYPKDPSKFFIKRIIGLPGETVSVKGDVVTIKNDAHPEGFTLAENYSEKNSENAPTITDKKITDGNYFVMGDNRPASSDSRYWGLLPKKDITGRVFLRLFPFTDIGVLPGEHAVY
jgi:signal peptidase I